MKTLNLLLGFAALAVTAMVIVQWQAAANLRDELAAARANATQPEPQLPAIDRSADFAVEIAALREDTKDLPRLRNEIMQLRAATNELVALQSENDRLTTAKESGATIPAPIPPGFIGKAQLADAGFVTPDATVQTFFWAVMQTNFHRIVETWSAGMQQKEGVNDERKRARLEADFMNGATEMMQRFNNFGVLQREQPSPTEQVLQIGSSFGTRSMKLRLVLEGAEWKIDKFE